MTAPDADVRIGDLPKNVRAKLGLCGRNADETVNVTVNENCKGAGHLPLDAATIARRKEMLRRFIGKPIKLPDGVTVQDLIDEGRGELGDDTVSASS